MERIGLDCVDMKCILSCKTEINVNLYKRVMSALILLYYVRIHCSIPTSLRTARISCVVSFSLILKDVIRFCPRFCPPLAPSDFGSRFWYRWLSKTVKEH